MKKQISLLFLTALLAACSSKAPNLVHTQEPILNIAAEVSPMIKAQLSSDSAWVKNITDQAFNLAYQQFWYDKNGVTQMYGEGALNESLSSLIRLQPQQKVDIKLEKPTAESVNYRLYLYLQ